MFQATVPIIRRNNCVFATLGYLLFRVDDSSMQSFIPPGIPDSHPHRITSTKCRKNTVVSPDDGPIVARNVWRSINILRINCATSWFYLQGYTAMQDQQNMKLPSKLFQIH